MGAACAAFISVAFPYANLVIRGSRPANTSLPFGFVAICVLLAVLRPVVARLMRRHLLSRDGLLVVFIMSLVATAVPTWGMIGQLLPVMTGAHYYATPENRWGELLLQHVPPWLTPADPEVSRRFYEGLPPGAPIPWGAWAVPLATWGILLLGLYAATVGIMLLLRRQWVDQEHLIYPLMRLPLELAEADQSVKWPPILRSPLLWIGVLAALIPTVLNGLHFYVPGVPDIRLRHSLSIPMQRETLFMPLWTNFSVVGFMYVVSADLGFSLWFFALVAALQTPLMRLAGVELGAREIYSAGSPAVSYQAMGAMILLVAMGLWAAREHLGRSWRAAWGAPDVPALAGEPAGMRTAWVLACGGMGLLVTWLVASGMPTVPAVVFAAAAFINFYALTRATVQGGIPVTRGALIPQSFTAHTLGSAMIGPRGLTSMGYAFAWTADIRVIMMTFVAHALKLWSETTRRPRGLPVAMGIAILISTVGGTVTTLHFAYTRGGVSLSSWLFHGNPMSAFNYTTAMLQNPVEPSLDRLAYLGIGAVVMYALTILHHTFLWWPLHPLGFAVASTQPVQDLWLSILIGWALKSLTMRYGGYRMYQRLLPMLLGLIVGQSLGCAGWLVADGIMGTTGNLIFVY